MSDPDWAYNARLKGWHEPTRKEVFGMTTPHEAVVTALTYITTPDGKLAKDQYYGLDNVTYEAVATAAIEALREGAHSRIAKAEHDSLVRSGYSQDWRGLDTSQIIDAILGPQNPT